MSKISLFACAAAHVAVRIIVTPLKALTKVMLFGVVALAMVFSGAMGTFVTGCFLGFDDRIGRRSMVGIGIATLLFWVCGSMTSIPAFFHDHPHDGHPAVEFAVAVLTTGITISAGTTVLFLLAALVTSSATVVAEMFRDALKRCAA